MDYVHGYETGAPLRSAFGLLLVLTTACSSAQFQDEASSGDARESQKTSSRQVDTTEQPQDYDIERKDEHQLADDPTEVAGAFLYCMNLGDKISYEYGCAVYIEDQRVDESRLSNWQVVDKQNQAAPHSRDQVGPGEPWQAIFTTIDANIKIKVDMKMNTKVVTIAWEPEPESSQYKVISSEGAHLGNSEFGGSTCRSTLYSSNVVGRMMTVPLAVTERTEVEFHMVDICGVDIFQKNPVLITNASGRVVFRSYLKPQKASFRSQRFVLEKGSYELTVESGAYRHGNSVDYDDFLIGALYMSNNEAITVSAPHYSTPEVENGPQTRGSSEPAQ